LNPEPAGLRFVHWLLRKSATDLRAEAIRVADRSGVERELIAKAAGLKWPMSQQRWWKIRQASSSVDHRDWSVTA